VKRFNDEGRIRALITSVTLALQESTSFPHNVRARQRDAVRWRAREALKVVELFS
jgi:hypothetical protein